MGNKVDATNGQGVHSGGMFSTRRPYRERVGASEGDQIRMNIKTGHNKPTNQGNICDYEMNQNVTDTWIKCIG